MKCKRNISYNEARVPTVASRSGTTTMEENGASRAVPRRDQIEASMLGVHRANCLVIAVKSPVGLSRVDRARHRVRLCPLTMSNHLVDLLIYTLIVVPIWLEPWGFWPPLRDWTSSATSAERSQLAARKRRGQTIRRLG